MDVLEGEGNLRNEEFSLSFREDLLLLKVIVEVTSWAILEDEIEVIGCLKGVVHLHYEWVRCALHDVCFTHCILELLLFYQCNFILNFHGHGLLAWIGLEMGLVHLAVGAVT